jgi:hypothetical protein
MIELDFGELSRVAEQVKLIELELLRGAMLPTRIAGSAAIAPSPLQTQSDDATIAKYDDQH